MLDATSILFCPSTIPRTQMRRIDAGGAVSHGVGGYLQAAGTVGPRRLPPSLSQQVDVDEALVAGDVRRRGGGR